MADDQPDQPKTLEKNPFLTNNLENNVLARMRTLLALERNYLAKERTQLAQFRTGIALTLFGPTASAIYFPSSVSQGIPIWFSVILTIFFVIITGIGLYWILKANSIMRILRKKSTFVKQREMDLIAKSQELKELLMECMDDTCDF